MKALRLIRSGEQASDLEVARLRNEAAVYARVFGIGLRRRRFGGEEYEATPSSMTSLAAPLKSLVIHGITACLGARGAAAHELHSAREESLKKAGARQRAEGG